MLAGFPGTSAAVPKGDESGGKEIPADGGERMRLALKADGERQEEGTNEQQNEQDARENVEELNTRKELKMGLRESSNGKLPSGT